MIAPPGIIDVDIDPVLRLAGLNIHWYGVLYAVAFGVALYAGAIPHLERRGVPRAVSERYATWAIVAGLIGARLYYVVQSSPPQGGSWLSHPLEIVAVWHGGMAFFGALIAAPLAMAVLAWRDHLDWWLFADAAAVFGVIGQPIGRIGNIINGDILGYQSDLPWATSYSHPGAILQSGFVNCNEFLARSLPCVDPGGKPYAYLPAGFYEAIAAIAIGVIVFAVRRRLAWRAGLLFIVYAGLYALSQLVVFFWRGSEPTVGLGLKQAQWTALVVGLVAVPLLALVWRRGLLDWSGEAPASTRGQTPEEPAEGGPDPAAAERVSEAAR